MKAKTSGSRWARRILCLGLVTGCEAADEPNENGDDPSTDAGTTDAPVEDCPASMGPTTHASGSVSGDEVWTAEAGPHLVTVDTWITGSVVVERCAEVRIAAQKTVSVDGELRTEGTEDGPVTITAMEDGERWASIRANLGGGRLSFTHTVIDGGGDPLNTLPYLAAAIDAQGTDAAQPTQDTVHVDHLEITDSASHGILLRDGAGFTADSTDLTVSGAQYPVSVWASAIGTLPTGEYTGNAVDEILIPAIELIVWDTTIHDRGVPYRIGHDGSGGVLGVESGDTSAPALLTIEAGVTLRFKEGGKLEVEHFASDAPASGGLVAMGTQDAPITFTSAEPSPVAGDWYGVWFGSNADERNRLDHVKIEYAGRQSNSGSGSCQWDGPGAANAGAVRFIAIDPPSSAFITNTEIFASAGHGIDCGWEGGPIDFLAGNDFVDVAGCWQSFPLPPGGCPATPPCPMGE